MAYQITSESYGRRLPKITATADSTDDLATLGTDWEEGSTCVIGSTTYSLDKVQGWVEPGSGGGGGGGLVVHSSQIPGTENFQLDKNWQEINAVFSAGGSVVALTTLMTDIGEAYYGDIVAGVSYTPEDTREDPPLPPRYSVRCGYDEYQSTTPTGTLTKIGGE